MKKSFILLMSIVFALVFVSCIVVDDRNNNTQSITGVYSDTKIQTMKMDEKMYQSALKMISNKNYPKAIGVLSDLGDYKDSKELVSKLRYVINGDYIAAGGFFIGVIKDDGTVQQIGGYENSKSTKNWEGVTILSAHGEYLEGLDKNGRIKTTCPWTYEQLAASPACSTNAMSQVIKQLPEIDNVKDFQSDYPRSVIVLLVDGTVKILNTLVLPEEIESTKDWKNIVSVVESGCNVFGLREDGTVVAAGDNSEGTCDVENWTDIVAISGVYNTIGLKEDGTVVAAGLNRFGQCDVEDWTDIISIATGANHTVGLKRDGTVVATGVNSHGQCNVEDWTDIVAIDASFYFTIGLKSDGTLVLAGDCSHGKTPEVENVSGLFVPSVNIEN